MKVTQSTTTNTTICTTNTTNKGDALKVKIFGGGVVERLVWEQTHDLVYLCTKKCFDMLTNGDNSIRPIGFPKTDIIWD